MKGGSVDINLEAKFSLKTLWHKIQRNHIIEICELTEDKKYFNIKNKKDRNIVVGQ